jgi:crotonobetainyl-CoA:carnitine CoA-transferase CaiB-like acyl-CoA transferase
MITLVREAEWPKLCGALGLADIAADPRFLNFDLRWQNRDALYAMIRAAFLKKPVAEWVAILQGERLLADRVNTPLARIPQPQLGAVPLPMLPGLGHFVAEAPALGQHTNEVLAELR